MESITLISKKITFGLEKKNEDQFHDYLTDFYQQKLNKLKNQLNKALLRNEELQHEANERTLMMKLKEQTLMKNTPIDIISMSQVYDLKKQLSHSEQLLKQNQQFIHEQNDVISDLQAYVSKLEEQQGAARKRYELKVTNFDLLINTHHSTFQKTLKQFDIERKKLQKDLKETQIINVSLLEDKQRMESELFLKADELKLLSKKIFDQGLLITRLERQKTDIQENLLRQKNELIKNQSDYRKFKEEKLSQDQEIEKMKNDKQRLTSDLEYLTEVNKKLKRDLERYADYEKLVEEKNHKFGKQNQERLSELKIQLDSSSIQKQKYAKELKERQRRQKQLISIAQQLQQTQKDLINLLNKERETVVQLKQQIVHIRSKFQKEKEGIKQDISSEIKSLVTYNDQIVKRVRKLQTLLNEAEQEKLNALTQNAHLTESMNRLTEAFESTKAMVNNIQKQKYEQQQIINDLKKKMNQLQKQHRELIEQTQKKQRQIQEASKLKSEYVSLLQAFEEQKKELSEIQTNSREQFELSQGKEKDELKLLKEELCKKDFQIKQLTNKVQILQEQLRQADKTSEYEHERMTAKIKELQDIIQERFELTNRFTESSNAISL